MYNIKQPIPLTLAKAEELANTTSCPSRKGSTEAQLFLSGICNGETGRSTQAQRECWFKVVHVRETGIYYGLVEIMARRKRVKAKWDTIIIARGGRESSSLSFAHFILPNLSICRLTFSPIQKGRDIIFPSRPTVAILFFSEGMTRCHYNR